MVQILKFEFFTEKIKDGYEKFRTFLSSFWANFSQFIQFIGKTIDFVLSLTDDASLPLLELETSEFDYGPVNVEECNFKDFKDRCGLEFRENLFSASQKEFSKSSSSSLNDESEGVDSCNAAQKFYLSGSSGLNHDGLGKVGNNADEGY